MKAVFLLTLQELASLGYDVLSRLTTMGTNGNGDSDDDEAEEIRQNFGHQANYGLLRIMANYVIEARHHTVRLRSLYDELRMLPFPAEGAWGEKVLAEEERHYKAAGDNLDELKRYVRKDPTP